MKNTSFFSIFMLLNIISTMGCNQQDESSIQPNEGGNLVQLQALKDLETKTGILFPADTLLVNSGDGGGRDSSYGFYEWTVFSSNEIKLPRVVAPGVKDYLNLPLQDAVKFVQQSMPNRKIVEPHRAFSSEWENNNYNFRGTLVRSSQGDYLLIEQFRKK